MEDEMLEKVSVDFARLGQEGGERLRGIMEEYGMAVVKGVVAPKELKELECLFGEDLASVIDTDALLSACPSSAAFVEQLRSSLAKGGESDIFSLLPEVWPTGTKVGNRAFAMGFGIPQGQFAWGCRNKLNIRKVFAAIHSLPEEELCVGLDTAFYTNFALPQAEESNRLWPHADQNVAVPESGEWDVYQSILYVRGSDEDKGLSTTVVWPKSHKQHFASLMADKCIQGRATGAFMHYSPISDMANREVAATLNSLYLKEARRIPVPAGSLLVWSSRTIHQGHAGGRRLAMPICWEPVSRRTAETLRRKIRLVLMGFASTHWASLGHQHDLQALEHKAQPPSDEADLAAWVEFVEGVLSGSSPKDSQCFHGTQLPCCPRIAPGCLLPGKEDEYKEIEAKAAKDVWRMFAGVDRDVALSDKILTLFDKSASLL